MIEIPPHDRPAATSPGSSGTVMVVDDDRLVLLTVAHGLRQAGFDVLEADNGDDAILLARTRQPDLALLDIRMQGLSGFDVAQHLKDYEGIPFMFISAFADEQTRAQARELGALACLNKPLDMRGLVASIQDALETTRAWCQPTVALEAVRPGDGHSARTSLVSSPAQPWPERAVALGLLMQREGLRRSQALGRMQELAAAHGGDLERAARALLREHEGRIAGLRREFDAAGHPGAPAAASPRFD